MTAQRNKSLVTEFILLGFSVSPLMNIVLFVVLLVLYLVTVTANGLIITVVQLSSHLHSPMYFFLCNLAFLDICFLSTTVPKCMEGMVHEPNIISFSGCAVQMYIGLSLGITQGILLAVMSWDRFVAICSPLNYHSVMTKAMCIRLAFLTWVNGFLLSVLHVCFTMTAQFCGHNKINHAVCELAAVLRLVCNDIRLTEVVTAVIAIVVLIVPLSLIVVTYFYIISTIIRMPTADGRHRAFSTCSSHLVVVTLFYGTLIVMYMRPRSLISPENEKVISLFYGAVSPALNPLIYTLRNKEVKAAVKKTLTRNMVC